MRMKNTVEIMCLGLAILVGTSSLGAAQGDKPDDKMRAHGPRHSFEELDANGDGRIVASEMEAHRLARFTQADTDGNGLLSEEEMTAKANRRVTKRVARMIKRHDADGDGSLSVAEMQAGKGRHGDIFSHLDKDSDGAITKEEFEAGRKHGGKHKGHKKPRSADE